MQAAQFVGEPDGVAAGAEEGGRALQQGDVAGCFGHGEDKRGSSVAGADHKIFKSFSPVPFFVPVVLSL